jgi:hypothetical protein
MDFFLSNPASLFHPRFNIPAHLFGKFSFSAPQKPSVVSNHHRLERAREEEWRGVPIHLATSYKCTRKFYTVKK